MFSNTDFVKFCYNALEPKLKKYRHILQGDLLRHSKAVLPGLTIIQYNELELFM